MRESHRHRDPQPTLFYLSHDPDAARLTWPTPGDRSLTRAICAKEDTLPTEKKQPAYPQSRLLLMTILIATMTLIAPGPAIADDVTDWNQYMFQAALIEKTSPVVMTRGGGDRSSLGLRRGEWH